MLSVLQSLNTDTVSHRVSIKSIFDEDTVSSNAQLPVCLGEQFLTAIWTFSHKEDIIGLNNFPKKRSNESFFSLKRKRKVTQRPCSVAMSFFGWVRIGLALYLTHMAVDFWEFLSNGHQRRICSARRNRSISLVLCCLKNRKQKSQIFQPRLCLFLTQDHM